MAKTKRIFVSLTISLIFLLGGFAIPASANTPTPTGTLVPGSAGHITFHVQSSENLSVVPPDSIDKIEFDEHSSEQIGDTNPQGAFIQTCHAAGCMEQDIFFKIQETISWSSEYNQALISSYDIGSTDHMQLVNKGDCGIAFNTTGHSDGPFTGSCNYTDYGIVPASQLNTDPSSNQLAFLISFNDLYHLGTVDITYQVIFSTSPITEGDCSSQWLTGTKFATFMLDATNSAGIDISSFAGWPGPGAWVEIEVANGSHWNNGTGPNETDLAVRTPSLGNTDLAWHPLQGDTFTGCTTSNVYYYQIATPWSVFLRVNDLDGAWWNNLGTLQINLYKTTYSPVPSGCDSNYIIGSRIETESIPSTDTNGILMGTGISDVATGGEMGVNPPPFSKDLRYLVLETNIGPHWNGGAYTYSGEIDVPEELLGAIHPHWYQDVNLPSATCVVHLDTIGHVRVYFPYSPGLKTWRFRGYDVDGIPTNNQGSAGYTLYYANALQVYTPGNPSMDCGLYYTHAATGTAITLAANNSLYHQITVTGGNIYAIKTSGGPWYNNGVATYGVAISTDGANWDTLYDYQYALCAQATDGNHYVVYFQPLVGQTYYLRVDDPGEEFTDNTGSIVATVYGATAPENPWSVCTDSYILSQMDIPLTDRTIPANLSQGIAISYIESGKTYALEISGESYWNKLSLSTENRFDADISDDGGATWQPYQNADFVSCTVVIADDPQTYRQRFRIVFPANGNYRIRVHDDGTVVGYGLYSGHLVYILSEVNPSNVITPPPIGPAPTPTPNPNPPYTPPGWETSCYGVCNRPGPAPSLITWQSISFSGWGSIFGAPLDSISLPLPNVIGEAEYISSWIDYSRCAIQTFISWCPEHTAALEAIPGMFQNYEPLGTITELDNAMQLLGERVNGLIASGGEGTSFTPYSVIFNSSGGEEGGSTWQGIMPILPDSSPWAGGQLEWNNGNGLNVDGPAGGESGTAYIDYCMSSFKGIFKDATSGICIIMNLVKNFPTIDGFNIWVIIQLFVDVGAIIGFIKYVMAKWIDLAGSA